MSYKKTLIAAALTGMSLDAAAAAFQLAEHSASGLGRGFAGEAAVADDASVVARNPALMTTFDKTQVSLAASVVVPDVSLKGTGTSIDGVPGSVLDDNSIAPSAIIPAGYYVEQGTGDLAGFSFGLGLFSNFGLATEFEEDYAAGQIAGETSITTVNLATSLAYQVNDTLSIGGGLNYVYADAEIIRRVGLNPLGAPTSMLAVDLAGDDTGIGWNLGVAVEAMEGHRFGAHYRSEVELTFEGEYSNALPVSFGGLNGLSLPGTVDLTLPAIAEFSGSHQLDEQLGLHYSIMWTGWSSFENLAATVMGNTVFNKEENFSNAMRFSIGGDYQYNENLMLRAGIAYDESPADPMHRSISIPDTDRMWYSVGAKYVIDSAQSVDLGFSYLHGKTQRFDEKNATPNPATGQYAVWSFEAKGNAYLFAAQYNYQF